MADGHGSKPHETVALVGLAGLAGAAGVTWLAGATAIRLSATISHPTTSSPAWPRWPIGATRPRRGVSPSDQ